MADESNLTFHMIGHGHIDPTWLWRWTEGYEEVRATFRSALERMRETPDFKFTASSACFYQWFKESEPTLYRELKQRVAEGRWEVAGGWWLEPDCNVPCGESFVRHGLYGLRFFKQEFGVDVKVGFNPDSFGHAATFPQILKGLGQDYYAFMRPMAGAEKDYPGGDTFWWESPDGTRVLTANIHESYNTIPAEMSFGSDDAAHEPELVGRAGRASAYANHNPAQTDVLFFYGVGNHGGGPTKASIRWILAQRERTGAPALKFSTLQAYFEAFKTNVPATKIPRIAGELQHHARGCYSLHHTVKRLNRRTEHALMAAERLSSVAAMLGAAPYPKATLENAWKDLLYNQFHDILAGTSLPSTYADTRDQVGAARHAANTILNHVQQVIAREIDTTASGNTVVVFNSLPWPVEQPVEISENVERTSHDPAFIEHMRATFHDDDGAHVPAQVITGERVGGRRYVLLAKLPALGYRCYHARPQAHWESAVKSGHSRNPLEASAHAMENAHWRLEFDPGHGGLSRWYDKRANVEILRQGAVLAAVADGSDTWGHGVKSWHAERGRFGGATLQLAESGDVLGRVLARTSFGASSAITEYTLYRDTGFIDIRLRVNWQESCTILKWIFETNLEDAQHIAECAYGQVTRAAGSGEEPCQQWVTLDGYVASPGSTGDKAPYALTIHNDSVFSYDASANTLRLSLLRSPAYAHHDPCILEAHKGHEIMDQGWQEFRFRLAASPTPADARETTRRAWDLNVPPAAHIESGHAGARPREASFIEIDAPGVVLGVVKQAEDGDALIVRSQETTGHAIAGTLRFPALEKSFPMQWTPYQVKTVRIDTATGSLRETNLLEA